MEVKQEPLENFQENTIFIKQENVFNVSPSEVKIEKIKTEEEPQKVPSEVVVSHSKYDSWKTQNSELFAELYSKDFSEVQAFKYFITPDDLNLIKQDMDQTEYLVTKTELISDYCALPTLNSEKPCSSKHQDFVKQSKQNSLKNKFKRYFCPVCQKAFEYSKSRLKHLHGHFKKGFVICFFCGNFFREKFQFLRHSLVHFVKNSRNKSLQHALLNRQNLSNYVDNYKLFSKQIILKSSLITNLKMNTSEKPHKCYICFKQFKRKDVLNGHIKIHTGEKPFKCDICFKKFISKTHLEIHFKTHTGEKPFKCDNCSKQFITKPQLTRHSVIHNTEKPFKCHICVKQFKRNDILGEHLKTHNSEKQFKCNICFKHFISKAYLAVHLKTHTGRKPFKCDICFKQFACKANLTLHLKIHTGEKAFKCDICLKQFISKSKLTRHSKIHTNKQSFKCENCSRQLKSKSKLTRHLKIHSDEKPFKCEICSKQFKLKSKLKRHFKIHTDKSIKII